MHLLGSRGSKLRFSYDPVTYPHRVASRGVRRHRLADWTDADGALEQWLQALGDDGWLPYRWSGALTTVDGPKVLRFTLYESDERWAAREGRGQAASAP